MRPGPSDRRCIIASANDPYLPTRASWAYVDAWEDESETLREARARAAELGCVPITRPAAALLRLLAASVGAQAIVEIGTGAGLSGAAMLSGMTSAGVLTSIDIEAENQRVARETFTALGYDHVHTRLIAGRALDVLPRLSDAAYDIVFVDGDKTEYPAILAQAKRLLRVGGLAIFDNVLWSGRVADPGERDAETVALRDVTSAIRTDDDWMPALLTVGDGLLVASLRNRS
jgi:predicted O-methyltransferase YrrM